MKNLMNLGLALTLGTVAAGMNWIWLDSQARPSEFVGLKKPLEAGETINEKNLIPVPVPGTMERLQKTFIPFANRAVLFGSPASRDYEAGDVVFQRDIQQPPGESNWDHIGPFQLISVGEKFSRDDQYASRSNDHNVTIAVGADFDERTRRLLEFISPDRNSQQPQKIAAIQVVPSRSANRTKPITGNVVYQTVSLQGIAHVPRVLLEGDMIRFVVRARPTY